MWELSKVQQQLVIQNESCAQVAVDLAYDGTLHLIGDVDMAELGAMREDSMIDLGQLIDMGEWHTSEAFMTYLYGKGMEW